MPEFKFQVAELKEFYIFFSSLSFYSYLGLFLIALGLAIPQFISKIFPEDKLRSKLFLSLCIITTFLLGGFLLISVDAHHKKRLRGYANTLKSTIQAYNGELLSYDDIERDVPELTSELIDDIVYHFDNDFIKVKVNDNKQDTTKKKLIRENAVRLTDSNYIKAIRDKNKNAIAFYREAIKSYLASKGQDSLASVETLRNNVWHELADDMLINVYNLDTSTFRIQSVLNNNIRVIHFGLKAKK